MTTKTLVHHVLNTKAEDIPEDVLEHGKKSFLNWMGVAIGASHHESVDMVLALKEDLNGGEQVSIMGRKEKVDIMLATLVNGMSSHIFDFDDTHLDTIHHPSGPVAPIAIALGEHLNLSGSEILHAYILGCEAELRISNAIYPSHYDIGWHITGSTGVFGAAVAAGILLKLTDKQMAYALGIAGTQPVGLREMFGTMTKPLHPGKAGQHGLLAALLAKKGFTSSTEVLEAKRGYASVLAPEHDLEKVNVNWGVEWELLKNAFKPYACGIVLHPSIDACIQLRDHAKPEDVKTIELNVNPYVLELTGKPTPQTGLEGKFSIYHTAAIAFLDGDAGEAQYSNGKVLDTKTVEFREKIKPIVNENIPEEKVVAKLILNNGEEVNVKIEHATGSIQNPMTIEALTSKFEKLSHPIIGEEKTAALIKAIMDLDTAPNLNELITHTVGK